MKQQSTRSPFFIINEAISPLQCELVVDSAEFVYLDVNKASQPIMTAKHTEVAHTIVTAALERHKVDIEAHYQANIMQYDPTRVLWADETVSRFRR